MTGALAVLIMRGLMAHALRERSTPAALAQGRQVIDFEGRVAEFGRLADIVARELAGLDARLRPAGWRDRPLRAQLAFSFADVGETLPAVSGRAQVRVPSVCQRCLEPCELDLDADIGYLLVPANEAVSEPGELEVWELDDARLRPSELVEEVLIMALPISTMHADPADCGPLARQLGGDDPQVVETARPFANLRTLMNESE